MTKIIILTFTLCLGATLVFAATTKKAEKIEVVPTIPVIRAESQEGEVPTTPAPAAKLAGEEINWQVISGGGSMNGTSTNYIMSGTIGQTAVGDGASGSYGILHGFWQVFTSGGCCDTPGDANNDGSCNIGDAVYLTNYVFKSATCPTNPPIGCPPPCAQEGDANYDGGVNIGDAVYINNYVFRSATSPAPQCGP